ncbi:unnamed protein product, partial [marine sediment metagenome]
MNYHALLKKEYKNWKELECEIEKLPTTKEKGDVFER